MRKCRKALVFGCGGQAGSYLCEFLLAKGYEVWGTTRRIAPLEKSFDFLGRVHMVRVDLSDPSGISYAIRESKPDEIYNLASQMFAPASWETPTYSLRVNGLAVVTMLEAIEKFAPEARFFQAGSAEVFQRLGRPCDEDSPLGPINPYGVAKAMASEAVRVFRQEKGTFACAGTLFNMESGRRPDSFFSRKVVTEVVRMRREAEGGFSPEPMELGSLVAQRDWGLTREYVEAMWLMLQAPRPKDYVIGTGRVASCQDFVAQACWAAGISFWKCVKFPPPPKTKLEATLTADTMCANPFSINVNLRWEAKTKFPEVVHTLVAEEIQRRERGEGDPT